jgi:hypothetical protein
MPQSRGGGVEFGILRSAPVYAEAFEKNLQADRRARCRRKHRFRSIARRSIAWPVERDHFSSTRRSAWNGPSYVPAISLIAASVTLITRRCARRDAGSGDVVL